MPKTDFPENYKGFQTEELLKTWKEIKSQGHTNADAEQILAMSSFLREYKFAIYRRAEKGEM